MLVPTHPPPMITVSALSFHRLFRDCAGDLQKRKQNLKLFRCFTAPYCPQNHEHAKSSVANLFDGVITSNRPPPPPPSHRKHIHTLTLPFCTYLPPANEVCEGYVFTCVCQSFCSQGGGVCLSACLDTPPGTDPPRHPPGTPPAHPALTHPSGKPPRRRACWEIWSMRGRYASYWNAILFMFVRRTTQFLDLLLRGV